jgi:hypothetical protein
MAKRLCSERPLADSIAKDYTSRYKTFNLELLVELLLDFRELRLYPEKVTLHREERYKRQCFVPPTYTHPREMRRMSGISNTLFLMGEKQKNKMKQ